MPATTPSTFVSAPLHPIGSDHNNWAMAMGTPGLPVAFNWREGRLTIASVEQTWRESGPCTHGSSELYVKKHWFEVLTNDGRRAKLYFDRSPQGSKAASRWWLYCFEA